MIMNVTRKVSRAIPTATAMTIPATTPFESRPEVEEFADGAWAVDVDFGVVVEEDVMEMAMFRRGSAKD